MPIDTLPNHWPTAVVVVDDSTVAVTSGRTVQTVTVATGAVTATADAPDRLRATGGAWEIGGTEVRWVPEGGSAQVRWTGTVTQAASDGAVLWVDAEGTLVRVAANATTLPAKGVTALAAGNGVAWVDAAGLTIAGPDGKPTCTLALAAQPKVDAVALDAKWAAVSGGDVSLLVDRAACKVAAVSGDGYTALGFGGGTLYGVRLGALTHLGLPTLTPASPVYFSRDALLDARSGKPRPASSPAVTASTVRVLDDGFVAFDPGQLRILGFDGAERVSAKVPFTALQSAAALGDAWVATDGNTVVGAKGSWVLPGVTELRMMDPRHAAAKQEGTWRTLDLEDPAAKVGQADDRPVQTRGQVKAAHAAVMVDSDRFALRRDGQGVRVIGRWDLKDRGTTLAMAADVAALSPDGAYAVLRDNANLAAFEVATGRQLWTVALAKAAGGLDLYRGVVHAGNQRFTANEGKPTTADTAPMAHYPAPAVGEVWFDPAVVTKTFSGALDDAWCQHRDELAPLLADQQDLFQKVQPELTRVCGRGPAPRVKPYAVPEPPTPTGATCAGTVAPAASKGAKPVTLPMTPGLPTIVVRAAKSPFDAWFGGAVDVLLLHDGTSKTGVAAATVTLACVKDLPKGQALLVDGAGKVRAQARAETLEGAALALTLGTGANTSPTPAAVAPYAKLVRGEGLDDKSALAVGGGELRRYTLEKGLAWSIPATKGFARVGDVVVVDEGGVVVAHALEDGAARWGAAGELVGVSGTKVVLRKDARLRVVDAADPGKVLWTGADGVVEDDVVVGRAFGWACTRTLATGTAGSCAKATADKADAAALPAGFVFARGELVVKGHRFPGVVTPEAVDAHRVVFAAGGALGPRVVVNDQGAVVAILPAGRVIGAGSGVLWLAVGDDAVAAWTF